MCWANHSQQWWPIGLTYNVVELHTLCYTLCPCDLVPCLQLELLLSPLSEVLSEALAVPPAAACPTEAPPATTTKPAGGKAAATGQQQQQQQQHPRQVSLQLLLDPELCCLPWEALTVVKAKCGSVARCFSLAQLQSLLQPPRLVCVGAAAAAEVTAGAGGAGAGTSARAAVTPPVLEVSRLSYIVDPQHQLSEGSVRPGCYAAPLIQGFR